MDVEYREIITVYLKGMAMGAADAVPGVSGGTIALITGIYQQLISAITSITAGTILGILTSGLKGEFGSARDQVAELDLKFLLPLGAGIATAFLLVLNLMHFMISNYPVHTYGFFFGLIAVSALVLYSEVDLSTHRSKLAALTGFIVAFLLSGYGATSLGNSLPVLFLAGSVAISAMILPGISGSLILVILGQYDYITAALSRFTDALLAVKDSGFAEVSETAPPILVFASGAVVGLFSIANLVEAALTRYRKATMTFLVSMILGALRAPVVEVNLYLTEQGLVWITVIPQFLISAVVGGVIVFALDYRTLSDSIT